MKNSNTFRFENKNDDFPFYNDQPPTFKPLIGIGIIIIIIGSFFYEDMIAHLIPAYIAPFFNIILPLALFIPVVKSNWTKIFRKIYLKDLLLVVAVLIVNQVITVVVALLLVKFIGVTPNPAGGMIEANSLHDNILFFAKTIPMLFGEELVTIIPFLIILQLSYKNLKLSRKKAIVIAWIVSSLLFAAIHLPTYNWNIVQAIVGIGIVRMVITYPYIKTKNIWISFFVHLLNDWILLFPMLLAK